MMDKLIRFINEYGHTSNCGPFETCRIEPATEWNSSYLVLSRDDNGEGDWKVWHLEIPRLISKEYGFIKWLVEKDKIDYHNKINYDISLAIHWREKRTTREERLLMILAIQDEPIKFLVSILK